jgi:hypothetical protein
MGESMTGGRRIPAYARGDDAVPSNGPAPIIVGAVAGDERRRRYGGRIADGATWVVYDSLDLLPHLVLGVAVESVVVDLLRWTPLEAAPALREIRRRRPELRVIGVYEPSAETLPEIADLARGDRRLAFACDADQRFELLTGPAPAATMESPTACQPLLEQLLPLANGVLRAPIIHLALAPSRRQGIPTLAAMQGWSEDALERRFGEAGLVAPAAVRRIAIAAEGLWHAAGLRRPASEVARALGLGTGDSLGRMVKGVFGLGINSARFAGPEAVRHALAWVGLLALRDLAPLGGLPVLTRVRFAVADAVQVVEDRGALIVSGPGRGGTSVRLADAGGEVWDLLCRGESLGAIVARMAGSSAGSTRRFAEEALPMIRWLLRHRIVEPVVQPRDGV